MKKLLTPIFLYIPTQFSWFEKVIASVGCGGLSIVMKTSM